MRKHILTLCAAAAAAALWSSLQLTAQTPPQVFSTATGQRIRVTEIAGGLVHPYSLAFPDARTILVAERSGRLRVLKDGVLQAKPAWEAPAPPPGSPATAASETLHFIVLHPAFAQNHRIYLSYPKYGPKGSTMAVGFGTLTGDEVKHFKEIFAAEAWGTFGANPGRMMFLRDGTLLLTVGDRDGLCCNGSEDTSQRMRAQALDNDFGKILRIRDDGSIPPDNPFVKRAGALPQIYTYGNRNAYGLAYHPETGELWESEIGPLGGDELNVLQAGHNYGWPLVSTGRNYTGTPVSDMPWHRDGMDDARMSWIPSISPSGLIFYTGDRFKGWKNSAFIGALNGKALWRVTFGNPKPQQAEQREVLLASLNVRVRDVQQGPDGNLYLATELESGGANPTGTVLRIEPAP
ncbi:MAG TPA: PQQ-dependent sugar dehydrogenase [Vicinamibacterales bacterium]|nr:PQQ-dependent sugar dehydrogenase [Vicinamibacterales bacterium]